MWDLLLSTFFHCKLLLDNEPGPSARCRRARGLCNHLRGKPIRVQRRERRSNENRPKRRRQPTSAKGLTAKKVSGYVYIPKPLPFVPGARDNRFVPEVSGAFTFTPIATRIVNVDTLLACTEGRLVSTKPRCNLSAGVALWPTTKITARAAAAGLMPTCYRWGQTRRQVLSNSVSLSPPKLAPEHRVTQGHPGSLYHRSISRHIPPVVYFTDPAWGRVSQTERG